MKIYRAFVANEAMVVKPLDLLEFWRPCKHRASPVELAGSKVEWVAPECKIGVPEGVPLGVVGDVYRGDIGQFCLPQKTLEKLGETISDYCDLYPVNVPKMDVQLVNVHRVLRGVVDLPATGGEMTGFGYLRHVKKWVFRTDSITKPGLFRVPENRRAMLVATQLDNKCGDFYARYHELGLSGLRFKLLWEG